MGLCHSPILTGREVVYTELASSCEVLTLLYRLALVVPVVTLLMDNLYRPVAPAYAMARQHKPSMSSKTSLLFLSVVRMSMPLPYRSQ